VHPSRRVIEQQIADRPALAVVSRHGIAHHHARFPQPDTALAKQTKAWPDLPTGDWLSGNDSAQYGKSQTSTSIRRQMGFQVLEGPMLSVPTKCRLNMQSVIHRFVAFARSLVRMSGAEPVARPVYAMVRTRRSRRRA
jgi:hypothetical protein